VTPFFLTIIFEPVPESPFSPLVPCKLSIEKLDSVPIKVAVNAVVAWLSI